MINKARASPTRTVGQTLRISKEKMPFAMVFEQNCTLAMFRISKVLRRSPRPVYELEDLRGDSIDRQFYAEELPPLRITKRTKYLVDKILDTRVRRGIRVHLVRWKGYRHAFESSIPASDIRRHGRRR